MKTRAATGDGDAPPPTVKSSGPRPKGTQTSRIAKATHNATAWAVAGKAAQTTSGNITKTMPASGDGAALLPTATLLGQAAKDM